MMAELKYAVTHPRATFGFVKKRLPTSIGEIRKNLKYLYLRLQSENYIDFYKKLQDTKVKERSDAYDWSSEAGIGQFEFMKRQGLSPDNTLLDIGCGNLRGGIHFIEYLNKNNYTGIDISKEAIEDGKEILQNEQLLDEKHPTLVINDDMKFNELEGGGFDFILAQSVFTHVPKEIMDECFRNIDNVLADDGEFFISLHLTNEYKLTPSLTTDSSDAVGYPFDMIVDIADQYGLSVEEVDFPEHPADMDMIKITYDD